MRTYDEVWAAAKDERPFSNGTEGYAWMGNWCADCINDSDELVDQGKGCPLILVAMMGRTPSEWIEQPWQQIQGRPEGELAPVLGDQYHCVEFRDEDHGGDDPPAPPRWDPEMPGQTTIFEAFADQVVEQFGLLEVAHA